MGKTNQILKTKKGFLVSVLQGCLLYCHGAVDVLRTNRIMPLGFIGGGKLNL